MQSIEQFIKYFLPNKYRYKIVSNDEKSDITIWDIYLDDNSKLRDDEINILICVENVDHWNWYKHYSKYGNYGNNKMHIYLYNHINKINKTNNYLAIPMIHNYLNYYESNYRKIFPSEITPFKNKKFCKYTLNGTYLLVVTKSRLLIFDYNKLFNKIIGNDSIYK
jgi:hypothetical protein